MATNSSILVWRIPWTEEPCGVARVGPDLATKPSPPYMCICIYIHMYIHVYICCAELSHSVMLTF